MDLDTILAQAQARYGLAPGYLRRTAQIESSLNPGARNPRSSAGGLFQFIDSTAQNYGLANKFDPVAATDAAARLARDNATLLRKTLGRDPNAAELYLAHQQGGGGAAKLLSNPTAPAVSLVGADAVRLNGGNLNMTAMQFAEKWLNKYNGQGGSMRPGASLPMMAQAGAPQPVTPGFQMAAPAAAAPMLGPSPIAAMFAMDEEAKQKQALEQQAEQTRRAALFGGPSPFG